MCLVGVDALRNICKILYYHLLERLCKDRSWAGTGMGFVVQYANILLMTIEIYADYVVIKNRMDLDGQPLTGIY